MRTTRTMIPCGHDHGHAIEPHESPLVMLVPLGVLSLGAVLAASSSTKYVHRSEGGSAILARLAVLAFNDI
jgi:NADH:ubiquinone oxidoreductase subunit 5 (subunit L)/multisubunit Na+/H+ antiporter MnhA subunit